MAPEAEAATRLWALYCPDALSESMWAAVARDYPSTEFSRGDLCAALDCHGGPIELRVARRLQAWERVGLLVATGNTRSRRYHPAALFRYLAPLIAPQPAEANL
jgi:hypothetical protein